MRVTVKQGMIQINQIWPVIVNPDVVILRADCVQKYPEIGFVDACSVGLLKGKHTLRVVNEAAGYTEITLTEAPPGTWECLAEAGRYTVTMTFYRTDGETDAECWYPPGAAHQLELPL